MLSQVGLPDEVRRRVVRDVVDGWFLALVADRSLPGWTLIVARAVELADPLPLACLTGLLAHQEVRAVAVCAATRGERADSAAWRYPGVVDLAARAHALGAALRTEGAHAFGALHVVRRVLAAWRRDGDASFLDAAGVVVQNDARSRARLRAIVAAHARPTLVQAALSLDALAHRLRVAAALHARSWAFSELRHDFTLDPARAFDPACEAAIDDVEVLPGDAMRTWTLLVTVKGRLPVAERWADTGSPGVRDPVWDELLRQAPLPPPDAARRDYRPVRAWLREYLEVVLDELQPALGRLDALAERRADRTLKGEVLAALAPGWDSAVPLPKSGFPTFVRLVRETRSAWRRELPVSHATSGQDMRDQTHGEDA